MRIGRRGFLSMGAAFAAGAPGRLLVVAADADLRVVHAGMRDR